MNEEGDRIHDSVEQQSENVNIKYLSVFTQCLPCYSTIEHMMDGKYKPAAADINPNYIRSVHAWLRRFYGQSVTQSDAANM